MLPRHSEGPCLHEIPAPVGLGDVSWAVVLLLRVFVYFLCGSGGDDDIPPNKTHSEIYDVFDLLHGRCDQHL